MDLPKKDKYGKNKLSYSQIECFLRSKTEYYNRYIKQKPFISNPYIDFGLKVEKAIETERYTGFSDKEVSVLKKATRLDLFQKFVCYEHDLFNVYGYIDTSTDNGSSIIDYKTGGLNKELKYSTKDYFQLELYSLCLWQMYGNIPDKTSIEFIRRGGNIHRGQKLFVKEEPIIKIDRSISKSDVLDVNLMVIDVAKKISDFYKKEK
jgi:hypothetical protein